MSIKSVFGQVIAVQNKKKNNSGNTTKNISTEREKNKSIVSLNLK